ncbi:CwfJ-like family protein [Citrus sinensis]|uniref:CwfJ-like family protein n=2 Tax=Citrus sinensis TaxID=2711 RepID=A0ACB8I2C4_CITSI|nr:CwfJ-like family protein [Citrus sinensis]
MGLEYMLRPAERTARKPLVPVEKQPDEPPYEEMPKVNLRELNPYLKDNGSGYPEDENGNKSSGEQLLSSSLVGDGGASWRLKALKRAQELWKSIRVLMTSNRDYLRDVTLRHPDMRAPKARDSLSWAKRKGQHMSARDANIVSDAFSGLNKFENDGSFMREFSRQQGKDPGGPVDSHPNDEGNVESEVVLYEIKVPSKSTVMIEEGLGANKLASKAMQLRLKGKHEEAEKLLDNSRIKLLLKLLVSRLAVLPIFVVPSTTNFAKCDQQSVGSTGNGVPLSGLTRFAPQFESQGSCLCWENLYLPQEVEKMKAKQGAADNSTKHQDVGSSGRKRPEATLLFPLGMAMGRGGEGRGPIFPYPSPIFCQEVEKMKAKQGAADNSTKHQDVGSLGRHVIYDLYVRKRKDDDDADRNLAQKIMHNKQYSISGRADDEYDFEEGPSRKSRKNRGANDNKGAERAIARCIMTQQERCLFCFENPNRPRHLVVAIANFTYLVLPQWQSVVPGHCCILSVQHELATRTVDSHVWDEIRNFKKCLIMMFAKQEKELVFLETVMGLGQQRRHCLIECIPLPQKIAKQAPVYFKKAIDEAEDEWSQHNAKKLIDTSVKGLCGSIPKDFPYFHVEFGLNKGFVHVIDDETQFKSSFGLNVIRGMLRLPEEDMYRHRRHESVETQKQAVATFAQDWEPFDWTKQLE